MTIEPTGMPDAAALGAYLSRHLAGFKGPVAIEKFAGGQSNPTFLLSAANGKYVLRRKPPGRLLASAHAVDREFRVISALADTKVPVARAYHLCTDDTVIGSMFYVMSFEDGRVFWDSSLPELGKADRAACHHDAISVLAALHSVDVDAAGLSDFGKPGNYFARQIARWSQQYRASETGTLDAMESLMEWLPGAIPPGADQSCLIHGDFNFENLMFHKHQPRVLAVLDWELSTLGHPLSDLAYYCMRLRLPRGKGIRGIGDMDRKELGIPGEEELVAAYCELRGIDSIDHWPFYLAFSFFRLAAIAQGVYKRALDGNASSERAIEVGKFARPLAEMGAALMD